MSVPSRLGASSVSVTGAVPKSAGGWRCLPPAMKQSSNCFRWQTAGTISHAAAQISLRAMSGSRNRNRETSVFPGNCRTPEPRGTFPTDKSAALALGTLPEIQALIITDKTLESWSDTCIPNQCSEPPRLEWQRRRFLPSPARPTPAPGTGIIATTIMIGSARPSLADWRWERWPRPVTGAAGGSVALFTPGMDVSCNATGSAARALADRRSGRLARHCEPASPICASSRSPPSSISWRRRSCSIGRGSPGQTRQSGGGNAKSEKPARVRRVAADGAAGRH
jgi:hypothetical protein